MVIVLKGHYILIKEKYIHPGQAQVVVATSNNISICECMRSFSVSVWSSDSMTSASLENFKRRSSGKDDNAWAQPPEPLTQAVGESFPVVITHFQSPSDIIVQKVEHAGKDRFFGF